jgi:uncharacterized protein
MRKIRNSGFAWLQGAELGNADCQLNLGTLYFNGLGVKRDYAKAMHW